MSHINPLFMAIFDGIEIGKSTSCWSNGETVARLAAIISKQPNDGSTDGVIGEAIASTVAQWQVDAFVHLVREVQLKFAEVPHEVKASLGDLTAFIVKTVGKPVANPLYHRIVRLFGMRKLRQIISFRCPRKEATFVVSKLCKKTKGWFDVGENWPGWGRWSTFWG
eukprot:FR740575.1.p1 GENE.FR740575.1~~FR740575.1.p1  ORF type:complete len:166 (+),score=15.24 FR740575.1:353-850(+)